MLYKILLLFPLAVGTLLHKSVQARTQDPERSLVNPRTIITSHRWQTTQGGVHLRNRRAAPFAQNCSTYYSANTNHAVCNGDRSIMCQSGCTGAIVAQNCQSNSTSALTTQNCTVAFSQTSEDSFLCTTLAGAFTCQGPSSGNASCQGCVPAPPGVSSHNSSFTVNGASLTGAPESHSSTGQNPQDSSTTSSYFKAFGPKSIFFTIVPVVLIYLGFD